ncbi:MAG TPA: chemotaxis protein CheB [Candidatus Polarisedimenticolia bacterium]|nr:chemotaxis protein CheB [Candidatus Polarisedimenticolia bacterium]
MKPRFPVVGVGASAGGLEAFTQLLRALPDDTGMAFVLVQHLAPSHESALAGILSRAASMPVCEVADEPEIEPNHVYVIPPNRNMTIAGGHLKLFARDAQPRHPIDRFLRSLAEDQGHMAIGVILSGTATDGTVGIEEIKAGGGITFAQDDTAQYHGMPQSAVASGSVDFVLPPEGIAAELTRIATHPFVAPDVPVIGEAPGSALGKADLAPILQVLSSGCDVDFSLYKASTLVRRITRRMILLKKDGLADYAKFLRDNPAEIDSLCQDILINVTGFFRDPGMFEALKAKVIPALLENRPRQDPLRVWVLGCSTGEEAYSLAMILSESMESSKSHAPAQIFATDVNLAGIGRARAGVYPKERLENVSQERLRRFFVEVDGSFRINKSIREMCVFSRHNAATDPPFSRMDLVSCRNLLIYLEPALQQRIVPILHYALKPTGYLILGASETVGQYRGLFGAEDAKHKIFVKKPGSGRSPATLPTRSAGTGYARRPEGIGPSSRIASAFGTPDLHKEADRLLLGFAPAAVLVDANFEILQFRGNIEPYLAPSEGKASFALLKMARPGLLVPLRALLRRARKANEAVREDRVQVRFNDESREVDLKVCPLKGTSPEDGGFLVVFENAPTGKARGAAGKHKTVSKAKQEPRAASSSRLEHELASTRDYLEALCEQHDAAMEELQSTNEEAQSANEELQSINEELETTKEEIQSSNEELTTINEELHSRNLELGQVNSDLTNLINSVQVPIIIVGRDLRIRRFSPMAASLLSIIPADVGRSISDIRMGIDLPDLESLLTEVIDTVTPKEREIQARDSRWYCLRLRPYLSLESKVDGAVLTMTDVDLLRRAREYAETIVDTVAEPVLVLDDELRVRSANRSFYEFFRGLREETIGRPVYEVAGGGWETPALRQLLTGVLSAEAGIDDVVIEHEFPHIGWKVMKLSSRKLVVPGETKESILLAFEDISERRRADKEHELLEGELRGRAEELDVANRDKSRFIAVLSHELRTPLNAISGWAQVLKQAGLSDDDRKRGVEVIARNSKMQAQLISDLLDVERIAGGKLSLVLRGVDLRGEVKAAIDTAQPAALEKQIRIDLQAAPDPLFILADSSRLQQVLGNLLSNAIKFTGPGGEIRVDLHQVDSRAETIVSDSGQGITAEALPHIFERFRQSEPTSGGSQGGLGLGLAVTKQLVELHGGSVSARSPGKGKGATFTVSLPLASEPRAAVAPVKGPELSPASLAGSMVLIVDDELEAREPVRRLLEEHGAEVLAVRSADEALEAIQQQRPDVLVSDIAMPGRDGYWLIRAIRSLPPGNGGRIPAIALTAFGTPEACERALQAGYTTHLTKPVGAAELVAALAALHHTTPPPPGIPRDSVKRRPANRGPDRLPRR